MGKRRGRKHGRGYHQDYTRRDEFRLDSQRIGYQIPSLETLLGIKTFEKTIRKGLDDSDRPFPKRMDPIEQKRLYDRSLRRQKRRRDDMLRKVAIAERAAREQSGQMETHRLTNRQVDRICDDRRKRRESLFAKKMIGKGKGSGKTRRYTEKSKVKC